MFDSVISIIKGLFCPHIESVKVQEWVGDKYYWRVKCLQCGHRSHGIELGSRVPPMEPTCLPTNV